jgi:predicted RNase H-like HicB family nuclease
LVEVMAKRAYTARYERDENNYWSVVVDCGAKGTAISDGQTLPKARRRIRQSVALLLDAPEDSFKIVDEVVLPSRAQRALDELREAEAEAVAKEHALQAARAKAVWSLVRHGLSRSDAGELLGVTKQRVQQVLRG